MNFFAQLFALAGEHWPTVAPTLLWLVTRLRRGAQVEKEQQRVADLADAAQAMIRAINDIPDLAARAAAKTLVAKRVGRGAATLRQLKDEVERQGAVARVIEQGVTTGGKVLGLLL
ncbi:MAG: hypothetical protein HY719_16595 [Planctomycetes bacterium]|nr:hypothetical protein [Planctomycetota bacterium]